MRPPHLGRRFESGVGATKILTEGGKVVGVETTDVLIATEKVLVAAGAWAPGLLETARVQFQAETDPRPGLVFSAARKPSPDRTRS